MLRLIAKRRTGGFTFLELTIAIMIIGLFLAVAIPNFMKARDKTRLNVCVENMKQIEVAKEQHAIEAKKNAGDPVRFDELVPYLKEVPECPAGGGYTLWTIGQNVECSYPGHEL